MSPVHRVQRGVHRTGISCRLQSAGQMATSPLRLTRTPLSRRASDRIGCNNAAIEDECDR